MNKDMVNGQELELVRQSLSIWGKIAPTLFSFGEREDGGRVRHG